MSVTIRINGKGMCNNNCYLYADFIVMTKISSYVQFYAVEILITKLLIWKIFGDWDNYYVTEQGLIGFFSARLTFFQMETFTGDK